MTGQSGLTASRLGTLGVYASLVLATVAAFIWIRSRGAGLIAPTAINVGTSTGAFSPRAGTLLQVLVALVVVILASRALGAGFRYLRQPPVIGEVVAGIALGPSLLGQIAPDLSSWLLPKSLGPQLGVLAQVGVILYMFTVGLALDTKLLRAKAHATLAISHASIIAPFLLGATAALWLYPKVSNAHVPFGAFALFMGLALSVTAFPVLARILTDRNLHQTRLGVIAISCAAVDDVTAWCLLALVVAVTQARPDQAFLTVSLAVLYVGLVFALVRPLVHDVCRRQEVRGQISQATVVTVLLGVLCSALTTELIGIHALFGAFLIGAVIPHDSLLAKELARRLEDVVLVLLLPIFFAFTGMRTQIGLVSGMEDWLICALIIVLACAGKFGGGALAARLSGLSWRDAAGLGVLLNTRGLMELIVLNVGLDLNVISPRLFTMMVIMAVVTTLLTSPLLEGLARGSSFSDGELSTARAEGAH